MKSFTNALVGKNWRLPLRDESDRNTGRMRVSVAWMPPEVYHVHKEICAIYLANGKQEKVATVDELLDGWVGDEESLLKNIWVKYQESAGVSCAC